MVLKLKEDWTEIAATEGTLYAPERSVEVSTEKENGSGILLEAGKAFPFKVKAKLYARAASGHAQLNVIAITLPTG